MSNQFMTERLETVILARLSTSTRPLTDAALASELARYAPIGVDGPRWGERVADCVRGLAGRGLAGSGDRVGRADELKRRTGAHAINRWQQWSDRALPGLALGVRADDARSHKRLDGRDAWSAAIVARAQGLWSRGVPPSVAELCDAVIWRALGLANTPKRCPGELRAHFLRGYIEIDTGPPERMLRQLAAKLIGAPRVELRAIYPALIRAWLGGSEPGALSATAQDAPAEGTGAQQVPTAPSGHSTAGRTMPAGTPSPEALPGADEGSLDEGSLDEGSLIDAVRGAARAAREGVFGDRKVFISSVWNALRAAPPWSALGIDEFKSRLILAYRRRELELARADLVAAMDPALVASSETRIEGATFHFIVREPVQ